MSSKPKYNGPETALATFRWEFAVLPRYPVDEIFSLDHHPKDWKNLSKSDGANSIHDCVRKIGEGHNGAAKLLLVIFFSQVSQLKNAASFFWSEVGKEAWKQLSTFHGQPEQYLGFVENVIRKNKGFLGGLVSNEGQKYFKVDKYGNLTFLSDATGRELEGHVIGKLPTLDFSLI